jgi:hypothetical protein
MDKGWDKVKPISKYMGLSERKCRDLLKTGLRHIRLPSGTILIKYSWADQYLEQFEINNDDHVSKIVDDVCQELM